MERLRVLITVKTYPIPSKTYDELVCTAGVTEDGRFIRLYPINFRDLPYSKQYRKYQWIEVEAERHTGRDTRRESWRPNCDTLRLGEQLSTEDGWAKRAAWVLPLQAASMEALWEEQTASRTSLGLIRPKEVFDLTISEDTPDWPPKFYAALKQARLWETRHRTKEPPRKVPWKFHYRFACDDARCNASHRMMIEDWEVGALYWRLVDRGRSPRRAAEMVREKFLTEVCAPSRDAHFFVGTVLEHGTWVIIGVYWPPAPKKLPLFSIDQRGR